MIQQEQMNYKRPFPIGLVIGLLVIAAIAVYFFTSSDDTDAQVSEEGQVTVSDIGAENTVEPATPNDATPAFDLVRISRGGTGVIAGRMAPGAVVELFANGEKISEVTADPNGEWVMILDQPLESGSVELNLKSQSNATGEVTEAEDVVVVSVPERDEQRFVEERQNGVVAVLSPKDGQGASRILQRPGVRAFAEVGDSLAIDSIDYGANASTNVVGSALPRVNVRLYLDDEFIGETRASDDGKWSFDMSDIALSGGSHALRVDQTIGEGRVQLRIVQPFEVGQPLDLSTAEGGVIVKPGNSLWQIARQLYGTGVRYTLIFRENSEQIADPDKIYPGQVFRLPRAE